MAGSTSRSPTHDPESPYYLHPDDQPEYNPTILMLSQAEDNYFIWKSEILLFLQIKNKTGFVDGTIGMPDPSSPLYRPWKRCNAMITCWLMHSLSKELRDYVSFAGTAHKLWEDLRLLFVPSVQLRIYELRQNIATMRHDGDPVSRYFGKFWRAWRELAEYDPVPECSCGGCGCEISRGAKEAREKEKGYAFLMGLNKGLSNARSQVLLKNPSPSLNQAYALFEQADSMMMNPTRR